MTPPPSEMHIILLIQEGSDPKTRIWSDHCSVRSAIEYIIGVYSTGQEHPNREPMDISRFYTFFDDIYDCVPLVYDRHFRAYIPHDKQWLLFQAQEYIKTNKPVV
ncbi:hypothetical protein SPOG_02632 [Schizosaccharomyces cryophilus OY26]|uniref:Enhancer of rudimentary-like protein n=2 Tax=Schizosaccharomyces cryophilus TaxID=866546 RepID=S9XCA6_SCHCR|nr:uncharacterized protein SPOG_02632 [Schizosaccharomyces cryophilus OY26]AFK79849.1 enhancer of rudimentary-like protein [Schizosaccharomyces cryophilus]AFK79853.1 enhancer of rudimentary-like protein [Schizosaccharomyces cryophilus]EPY51461.1 hypothetical protein SPOG_02632 [Schizosaccharomyces cryophilus OY26]